MFCFFIKFHNTLFGKKFAMWSTRDFLATLLHGRSYCIYFFKGISLSRVVLTWCKHEAKKLKNSWPMLLIIIIEIIFFKITRSKPSFFYIWHKGCFLQVIKFDSASEEVTHGLAGANEKENLFSFSRNVHNVISLSYEKVKRVKLWHFLKNFHIPTP